MGPLLALNWLSLLLVDPNSFPYHLFVIGYFMGSLFAHSTLAAAWAAFGPGRFALRFPLSIGWALSLSIAIGINVAIHHGSDAEEAIIIVGGSLLGQWLALQFPFWLLALSIGLHLRHKDDIEGDANPNQIRFGIRHLLIVMLITGVVLGIGRAIVTTAPSWGTEEILIFGFLAAAAVVVTLPLLLAALMRRMAVLGILLALLLMGVVTAWEAPLLARLGGSGPDTEDFVALNIGMATFVVACAVVVRLNGYCLYARARGAKP